MRTVSLSTSRLKDVFSSRWFWRASIVLFAIQSVYIACVGRFSMAFDEFYHFDAIRQYAKVAFPWQVTQPPGPAELGAFTAEGSYLYHYLMSVPYRIISWMTDNQTMQIVILRLIDVLFVLVGLYVFRRLLLLLGLPRWAAQLTLAFVMLLPVTPFLAAQLTYDTLFFVLTALTVLAMVRLLQDVTKARHLPLADTAWLLALVAVTSQVKYAFLPLALGGIGYITWFLWRQVRARKLSLARTMRRWKEEVRLGRGMLAVGVLLLASVFFVQRYGMNVIRYRSLTPSCDAVIGHRACLDFDPYGRDAGFRDRNLKAYIQKQDTLLYPVSWTKQMVRELYFTVGPRELDYPPAAPIALPYIAGWTIFFAGSGLLIFRARRLMQSDDSIRLIIVLSATYVGVLFAKNLGAYLDTGVPVAIHGRYVLPLLPLWGALLYRAGSVTHMTRRVKRYVLVMLSILLVLTMYGGGIDAYIIRSNDAWYWPAAQPVSRTVRSALWPLVLR